MKCTFFGHKDAPSNINELLKNKIVSLINEGVEGFYVGNNGSFDFLVQDTLQKIKNEYTYINCAVVFSRLDERIDTSVKLETLFPYELAGTLPRFAVSKRNEWLINSSDIAIVYVKNKCSNSYKWSQRAIKKGLRVINLFDE